VCFKLLQSDTKIAVQHIQVKVLFPQNPPISFQAIGTTGNVSQFRFGLPAFKKGYAGGRPGLEKLFICIGFGLF